ncbi:MAG TPA: Ig-like domain-containing protein, partial [Pseudomonadales bacterium]|nr:Ig-like domain-containing protein [Pseudomonadales bacterium]
AVTSGTITWTRTAGTADGGSPHAQALAGTELNTGAHTDITLTNNPTLVDGAIYTIAFDVTDDAGNAATTISNTGVTYDFGTETPTLTTPATSGTDNATLAIDFTLPEAALADSVQMTFTHTSGPADANAPHVITFETAFESAAQHTATLVANDLSNHVNVQSVSSGVNDTLVDGATYSVQISYQDTSSNSAATDTNTGFIYDNTAPVISATAPATDATVANNEVSYTLSEAVTSGTITWTRTAGTADGGSPHAQALAGAELNTGAHTDIILTNNPTLVDGTTYTIAFDVTDAAGNAATTISNTGVIYDFGTETPTLTTPANSSTDNSTLAIDFTLPEAALADSVKMIFTRTGGSADANAPHTITFETAFESAAQHTTTLDGTNLSNNANVQSVDTEGNDSLVSGAIYSVQISYQDTSSNSAATDTNTGFTYDNTAPVISATAPVQDATVANNEVSYTLSEAVASGTITWTRTGGSADGSSPHAQALAGTELNTGAHTDITLTNNPTLVDGAIYTIAFDVTDDAG